MTDWLELGVKIRQGGAAEQRLPCPRCSKGTADDALGVNTQTGAYHCFRCGWKGRAGAAGGTVQTYARIRQIDDPAIVERKKQRLRRAWSESISLSHAKARSGRNYLESRALGPILTAPPKVLRFHPGLAYWEGSRNLGTFPAMLALFHGANGQPVTLHATFLHQAGYAKASVPSPKKILGVPLRGATRGGAIHLYDPRAGILGLCEGIESALSMHLLQKIPVWSCFCADNLGRAHLPLGLREVHIGIDLDESGKGHQVAKALCARIREFSPMTRVFYVWPEVGGLGDLNDELRRRKHGST